MEKDEEEMNSLAPSEASMASEGSRVSLSTTTRNLAFEQTLPTHLQISQRPQDERLQEFADFILCRVLVNLIPLTDREVLCDRFNVRLQQAKDQGVELPDLEIGEDCLPTWHGWNWDPETESLHATIQERLNAVAFSQDLSILLRRDIINKGNKKFKEAFDLGIALDHITFGLDLLPQWTQVVAQPSSQPVTETPCRPQISDTGNFSRESSATSTNDGIQMPTDLMTGNESIASALTAQPEHGDIDEDADMTEATVHAYEKQKVTESHDGRDGASDVYSSSETDSEHSWDPQDDGEDSLPANNIVHDVEMLGGAKHQTLIEMEVYVAEDSDVEYIPEVELAIDLDSYEHHFGSADAIDIELPDLSTKCNNPVDFSDSESDDKTVEELTREEELLQQMGLRHGWVKHSMSRKARAEHVDGLITAYREKQREMQHAKEKRLEPQERVESEPESDISEEGVTTDEENEEEEAAEEDQAPQRCEEAPVGVPGQSGLQVQIEIEVDGGDEDESEEESDLEFEDVL